MITYGNNRLDTMLSLQGTLSQYQAYQKKDSKVWQNATGASAIIVSPIKAIISSAQLILGIAAVILFLSASKIFYYAKTKEWYDWSIELTIETGNHCLMGLSSLIHSAINFVTLGYSSLYIRAANEGRKGSNCINPDRFLDQLENLSWDK